MYNIKFLFLSLFIFIIILQPSYGQTKTKETKKIVNKETGDTTVTESVIISESEDITLRNNIFVINPLKFILFYNISYFHKVSEHIAVGGGFQIPTLSGINGFGLNAEVRIYPRGKNLRGFYLAPNLSYNHLTSGSGDDNLLTSPFSIGVLAGWQWFPGDDFALGLGIGIDYYWSSNPNGIFGRYNGFAPALRFDIGYAW